MKNFYERTGFSIFSRFLLAVVLVVGVASSGWGQTELLNAWNTNGLSGITPDGWGATTVATNLEEGQLSRGSGVTGASLSNGFSAEGWNVASLAEAKTGNKFFHFYVEASSGYEISLDNISFRTRRTSTGPNRLQLAYSLDNISYVDIGSEIVYDNTTDGFAHAPIVLSGVAALQDIEKAYFRLYGWGASAAGGTLAFGRTGSGTNDLIIEGEIILLGAQPPSISNITQNPAYVTSTDEVGVSADVSEGDADIEKVELQWGISSDALTNIINMLAARNGETYTTDTNIPLHADGVTVYYRVFAEDEVGESATSAVQSYTVRDPSFTTLPFEEDFETDLGDCYVYSVSGDTRTWVRQTFSGNGFAHMSGHDTGDLENDWLILPGIDMSEYDEVILTFESEYRYHTAVTDDNFFLLLYSVDYPGVGDPSAYNWTELDFDWPTDDGWGWIPSGDVDLPDTDATLWLAFQYHYEDSYPTWRVDNIHIFEATTPMITVAPETLSGFTYVEGDGPSAEQQFTVSGENLEEDITITAPTNYLISKTSGSGFTGVVTVEHTAGEIGDTEIFVILKAGLDAGTYNDEIISVASTGAVTREVSCSGEVTAPPPPPISIDAPDFNYFQDFNTLAQSGTGNAWSDGDIPGWLWQGNSARDPNQYGYIANPGSSTTAAGHSYGLADDADRAMGALTGSGHNIYIGVQFRNDTGDPIDLSDILISYTGEQWRQTTNIQSLEFSYKISATIIGDITTGDWTANGALNFSALHSGTAGALNGNLPENQTQFSNVQLEASRRSVLGAGEFIVLRWFKTGTTSPGLAVDDFSIQIGEVEEPVLTVDLTSIIGLNYTLANGPSESQTFELTGENLNGEDVIIDAPTDFEISEDDNDYSDQITLTDYDGTAKDIYVRLKEGLAVNSYSGNVTVNFSDKGEDAASVAVSGRVVDAFEIDYVNDFRTVDDYLRALIQGFVIEDSEQATAAGGYLRISIDGYIETPTIESATKSRKNATDSQISIFSPFDVIEYEHIKIFIIS